MNLGLLDQILPYYEKFKQQFLCSCA